MVFQLAFSHFYGHSSGMDTLNLMKFAANLDVWFDAEKNIFRVESRNNNKNFRVGQFLKFLNKQYRMSTKQSLWVAWHVTNERVRPIPTKSRLENCSE